ncbi:hypothetical protein [Variovorax sp. OV084]|jgi:hypothetical protein|uniref:hypothetical protein n=1 Tax=Variovorax sp. OV084 TaxID=1882777 RepID=UPI0008AAB021|nr:hypothetical protein [Variovorax sp. OV084]SET78113.1 hypothetical protein SAMN05443580_106275 [Variovorax sp. OV084]
MSSLLDGLFAPDNTSLPASYGNEALMRRQLQLRDREATLKEAAKAAREAAPPQGTMVSGIYVKPSMAQQLTPIAQQIAQAIQKKGLEADQTGYDYVEAGAVQQHMAQRPSDSAPVEAKLAWAQKGAQIPAMRSVMMDYIKDLTVNEPERIANRADKKDARAVAIAEAQRKQQEDLEYKRDRDASNDQLRRDLAGDSNDLRRTLAAAVRANGGGGGGDKASNYQIIQDAQGNSVRVNKLTGEQMPLGPIGRETAGITKERQEQGEKVSNAKKALTDLDEAERILPTATGSAAGSLRDTIAGAAGISTDGAKAAARLDQIASTLAGQVPRLGGSTSDKDLAFYKEQVGNLGDRSKPVGVRLAALKQVRKFMERASDPSSYASPTGRTAAGPSIRDAVETAAKKASEPSGKVRVYNPDTGRLE